MADPFAPRSMKRKNVKGLALTPAAPKPPPTAENHNLSHSRNSYSEDTSAQLEIGIEFNLDLRPEDLEIIKDLGSGNGGTVSKVKHIPTNTTMARKVSHSNNSDRPFGSSNLAFDHLLGSSNTVFPGHSCRGEARDAQAHRPRTPDHAQLPLRAHRYLLRCLSQQQQRCDYVHGVHGCWVRKYGPLAFG